MRSGSGGGAFSAAPGARSVGGCSAAVASFAVTSSESASRMLDAGPRVAEHNHPTLASFGGIVVGRMPGVIRRKWDDARWLRPGRTDAAPGAGHELAPDEGVRGEDPGG